MKNAKGSLMQVKKKAMNGRDSRRHIPAAAEDRLLAAAARRALDDPQNRRDRVSWDQLKSELES